jgi:hypothetical protein
VAWHVARTQPPWERSSTSISGQGVRNSVDRPAADHLLIFEARCRRG